VKVVFSYAARTMKALLVLVLISVIGVTIYMWPAPVALTSQDGVISVALARGERTLVIVTESERGIEEVHGSVLSASWPFELNRPRDRATYRVRVYSCASIKRAGGWCAEKGEVAMFLTGSAAKDYAIPPGVAWLAEGLY
jgi:hypothetical protein